jgi:hypothetical protein
MLGVSVIISKDIVASSSESKSETMLSIWSKSTSIVRAGVFVISLYGRVYYDSYFSGRFRLECLKN